MPAFTRSRERRMRPFRRINFDDVRVPHNQHRAFFAIATQTSHEVWPFRIEREDFGFDAFTVQNRFQVFNHDAFIAGRIAGVQAQNRLEVAHGFFFDLRPIRLRRLLRRGRIEQNKQREQSQTSERHEMPSESVWFFTLEKSYDRRNSNLPAALQARVVCPGFRARMWRKYATTWASCMSGQSRTVSSLGRGSSTRSN